MIEGFQPLMCLMVVKDRGEDFGDTGMAQWEPALGEYPQIWTASTIL